MGHPAGLSVSVSLNFTESAQKSTLVEAAEADLADRRVFVLEDPAWSELEERLSSPAVSKPRLTKLLENASVLEQ